MNLFDLNKIIEDRYGLNEWHESTNTFENWFNAHWNNDDERDKFIESHQQIHNIDDYIKFYKIKIYYKKQGTVDVVLIASYESDNGIEKVKKTALTSAYKINFIGDRYISADTLCGKSGMYSVKSLEYFDSIIKYDNKHVDTLRDYFSKHVDAWKNNDDAIIEYLRKYNVKIVSDTQYNKDREDIKNGSFNINEIKCLLDSETDGKEILSLPINTNKHFYAIVDGELYTPKISAKTYNADFYAKNADIFFSRNISYKQRSINELSVQYYIDKMLESRGLEKSNHAKIKFKGDDSTYEIDIKFNDKNHLVSKYDCVYIEYNGHPSHFSNDKTIARDSYRITQISKNKDILFIVIEGVSSNTDEDYPIKNTGSYDKIKTGHSNIKKYRYNIHDKSANHILDSIINDILKNEFNEDNVVADWDSNKDKIYNLYNPDIKPSSPAILNNYSDDNKIIGVLLSIMYSNRDNNLKNLFQEVPSSQHKLFKCCICGDEHYWDVSSYANFLLRLKEKNCLRFCCGAFSSFTKSEKFSKRDIILNHIDRLNEMGLNSDYEFKLWAIEQYKKNFSKYIDELDMTLPKIENNAVNDINFYNALDGKYIGSASSNEEASLLTGVPLSMVNRLLGSVKVSHKWKTGNSIYDDKSYIFKKCSDKNDLSVDEYTLKTGKKEIDIYKDDKYIGTVKSIGQANRVTDIPNVYISYYVNGKSVDKSKLGGYTFKFSDNTIDKIVINSIDEFNDRLNRIEKE